MDVPVRLIGKARSKLMHTLEPMKDPDKLLSKARGDLLNGLGVENEETDAQNCAYGDTPSQMTGGRILARFLSRFSCYYPKREGGPDLDKAWAHYEHMTLARIYSDEKPGDFVRAPFGEQQRPTELYPLWSTPVKSFADWGVSVRMYFSTLLALSAFLGIAGVLNLPLIMYFSDDSYTDGTQDLRSAVQGSAVCVDTAWVYCDGCAYEEDMQQDRMTFRDVDGVQYPYALKNDCDFENWWWPGVLSYGASILLLVQFAVAFFWLQRRAEIVFDEEMQTASDYSLRVMNPPADALDPDEWRDFFKKFGHVSFVTVAIDNSALLQTLISHKNTRNRLARKLPDSCDIWDKEQVEKAIEELSGSWCCSQFHAQSLWKKLRKIQAEVEELARKPYKAVSVFVTFETERAQRNALHSLSASRLSIWRGQVDTSRFDGFRLKVTEKIESSVLLPGDICQLQEDEADISIALDPKTALEEALSFRGNYVVNIKEAAEPNNVRWMDLEVSSVYRFLQFVGSTFAVLWFMKWSSYFIATIHNDNPGSFVVPFFIAVTNVLVPKICEFINKFETHATEGQRQASLYIKVALFRWFNSAIALLLVVGFTDTISFNPTNGGDNLNQVVYNLIFAEMVTIPAIKLADIMGIVRKHILAPRAEDQDQMNSYFIGGKFELAERYTDATKVLFVSLFYSTILPSSLFLGAIALLTHFALAKFCMLRMWRPSPDVGPSLSQLSRNYFFSIALLLHIVMSAYWWSGFPFDNLCAGDNHAYVFCNQDFLRSAIFPPLPEKQPEGEQWMTESQAKITSLYAWTAVVMLCVGGALFFKENVVPYVASIFTSPYEPDGADQKIPFSQVKHLAEVMAYIPQLRIPGFSHPLLVSDVSEIDHDVVGWKDSSGYLGHSLVHEAKQILGQETEHTIFAPVKQWLPEELTDDVTHAQKE